MNEACQADIISENVMLAAYVAIKKTNIYL